jgi:hypothetical protein
MSDLWFGIGLSLIILSITAPLSYCVVHTRPVRSGDIQIACIGSRMNWDEKTGRCLLPDGEAVK